MEYNEALQKLKNENYHIRWDRLNNIGEFFTTDKAAGTPRIVEGQINSATLEELRRNELIVKAQNDPMTGPRYDWYEPLKDRLR
jgi:hypothetical protein